MSLINKKSIYLVLISAVVISFIIIYYKNIPIRTVNISGEINKGYLTIQELKDDSDMIARVDIYNIRSLKYSDVVFTISEAKVSNVFKGDKKIKELKILETGGIYNNSEYIFEENKVFNKGQKAVVFLQKYNGPIVEDAYVVLGVFQGKFIESSKALLPSKHTVGELKQVNDVKDLKLE